MDHSSVHGVVETGWMASALPSLAVYIKIPALSPDFDASWAETGHLRRAVEHVRDWIAARGLPGAGLEILQLDGRSPLLVVDVPATPGAVAQGTVVLRYRPNAGPGPRLWPGSTPTRRSGGTRWPTACVRSPRTTSS